LTIREFRRSWETAIPTTIHISRMSPMANGI
jgi:hypothetical protein